MTFGATFGRTFSPTFQPSSQAAKAGGGWWNLNGTITSCIAAYQPKGAASYAASLVNLTGNTDYDATGANAPDWTSTDGWRFNGTNRRLSTGLSVSSLTWTFVVCCKATAPGGGNYGRAIDFSNSTTGLLIPYSVSGQHKYHQYRYGGTDLLVDGVLTAASVMAMANRDAYLDGSSEGTIPNGTLGFGTLYVGNNAAANRGMVGYVYSLAVYNATLTSTQISSLTTAMAAL